MVYNVYMRLKTNLHFHTSDDPEDAVSYSTKEGIDHAAMLGFDALALTCHSKAAWTKEYDAYAEARGILLIPGIELNIKKSNGDSGRGRHLIILNCTKEAERICTFADLNEYRARHPECFILAPHPFFYGNFSLKRYLHKHIALMDAIEHSWFYSSLCNRNKKAARVAHAHRLPFVATSDTHIFQFMDSDYAIIEAEEKSISALFRAMREHKVTNMTRPKKFFTEMAFPILICVVKNFFYRRKQE